MESTLRRTWAEIDLDALAHNYRALKRHIGDNVKFMGIVKADAYGHGSVQVSRCLQEEGADYLAVSSADEALELRANGISMPILILGHTPKDQVEKLIDNDITQAVTCEAKAVNYSEEAARLGRLRLDRAARCAGICRTVPSRRRRNRPRSSPVRRHPPQATPMLYRHRALPRK